MSIQLYSSPMKYKDPNTGNYVDIIGISGNPGRGISSVELNNDYTLTITFTDGTFTTTNSIRGAQGVGIQSVEKTNTSGLVDTYTITFDDNTISTFQVTNGASIDLHICVQGEYDSTTRVPTIQNPDSRTFYLVPNEDPTAPNAYTEWLYANGAWERFGAQVIDLSGYATKEEVPVESGTGAGSVKIKNFVYEGTSYHNTASGLASFAIGQNTKATGIGASAEGALSQASGVGSHAEGFSTKATNIASHAEGFNTIANSQNQHAQGKFNISDSNGIYANIVGNGTAANARSNAYALTWTGDGKYAGDIYVHANTDSSGGTKVATIDDIQQVATIEEVEEIITSYEEDEDMIFEMTFKNQGHGEGEYTSVDTTETIMSAYAAGKHVVLRFPEVTDFTYVIGMCLASITGASADEGKVYCNTVLNGQPLTEIALGSENISVSIVAHQ